MKGLLVIFTLFSPTIFKNSAESLRIISDLELIYGNQGVAVEYWYNETTNNTQKTSVPGCPTSIDGVPWIYYGNPRRCYLAAHHGPCPLEQKLLVVEGSPYGVCACKCVVDRAQTGLQFDNQQSKPRYIFCTNKGENSNSRGQIYDTKDQLCFEGAAQGPCRDGEMLFGVISDILECLPGCKTDSVSLGYLNGTSCYPIEPPTILSATASVQRGQCPEHQKYSKILQKCLENKRRT